VTAAHPALHDVGEGEGVQDLPHGGQLIIHLPADLPADVAAVGPQEHEQVVALLGGAQGDGRLLADIQDVEGEAVVHLGVDDRAGGAEGVGEDLVEGKFQAPGEVLSPRRQTMGSDGRSTNSISATPGPRPFTLPLKASTSKSWPAPRVSCSWRRPCKPGRCRRPACGRGGGSPRPGGS